MVDRISTFTQTNTIRQNTIRAQSELAEGQQQLSSGKISQTFDGIFIDAQRVLNIESEIADIQTKRGTAVTTLNRLEIQWNAIQDIIGSTQSYLADLNAALSGDFAGNAEVKNIARTSLDAVENLLNTTLNGRFIFAGSATQTRPVETEPLPIINAGGPGSLLVSTTAASGGSLNVDPTSATFNDEFLGSELDGGDEITFTIDVDGGGFVADSVVTAGSTIQDVVDDLTADFTAAGYDGRVIFNDATGQLEIFVPEDSAATRAVDVDFEITTLGDGANIAGFGFTATNNEGAALVDAGPGLANNYDVLNENANSNFTVPVATYEQDYYYGGNYFVQRVELDNGFELEYGLTARSDIFQDMIEAFNLVLNAPDDSDDPNYRLNLLQAYDQLDDSIDRLAEQQVLTSQDAQAVERTINDFDNEENLLVNIISGLTDVDLAQVTLTNTQLQNQLEASFSVTAQILRLSLIDFIR